MDGKGIILFNSYQDPYDVEANARRACNRMGIRDEQIMQQMIDDKYEEMRNLKWYHDPGGYFLSPFAGWLLIFAIAAVIEIIFFFMGI